MTGVIGIILLHNTHICLPWDLNVCLLQSRSFSSLLISGTACIAPKKKSLLQLETSGKRLCNIFEVEGGEAAQLTSSVIVCLVFHLHIKKKDLKETALRGWRGKDCKL